MKNPQIANALKDSLWKALENFTAEFDVVMMPPSLACCV